MKRTQRPRAPISPLTLAEAPKVTVRVEKPVHGGHGLARHEGRIIFVRHAVPGELVTVAITETAKVWRGEAINILEPSPDRVNVPWRQAGPGGVGAELAHMHLSAQRLWKRDVILDALQRIGKLELPVQVFAADDETDGWGSRTRIELTADDDGRPCMYAYRRHTLIPLDSMPLAVPEIQNLDIFNAKWPPSARLTVVAPSADDPLVLIDGAAPAGHPGVVQEEVAGHSYRVAAGGFWQVHRTAPRTLVRAVDDAVGPVDGATVFDLYSGSGLFSLPLADRVGRGIVHAVEGDRTAHRNARFNAGGSRSVHHYNSDVGRALKGQLPDRADVVVLDPPRAGARAEVMGAIMSRRPERIVYVSCDPAALARDLKTAHEGGYEANTVTGYDLFPHTHHIESLAVLRRRRSGV